jgi:hypothetical protein
MPCFRALFKYLCILIYGDEIINYVKATINIITSIIEVQTED